METAERLQVRVLSNSEIDIVFDWAQAEGWDPGLQDKAAFLSIDPEAFLGGFCSGQLVACISIVLCSLRNLPHGSCPPRRRP